MNFVIEYGNKKHTFENVEISFVNNFRNGFEESKGCEFITTEFKGHLRSFKIDGIISFYTEDKKEEE